MCDKRRPRVTHKKMRSLTFKPSLAVSFQAPGTHLSCTMAEEGRNHSIPSGHDEDYVYPPDEDFQCIICQLPSKEPVLTNCGHRFCKQCLEEYFRRYVIVESRRISTFKIDCLQAFDLAVFLSYMCTSGALCSCHFVLQMYSYESSDIVPMVSSLWGLFLFLNIIS